MERYTIGIYFDSYLKKVVLILKNRPAWQAGNYNFPGGHAEFSEFGIDCIVREFKEECGININLDDWKYIGNIHNKKIYEVDIFTAIQDIEHGEIKTMEDEEVGWFEINNLPKNIVSNVSFLIPFALNYWRQGNIDNLVFGTFEYN
jgi:8-oxo-dGTP diphosphatase